MDKLLSKFVRIAREGVTADKRTITREQIDQMAANYNPDKYGARIWLEHFRSLFADGVFPALGDVTEVRAEDDEEGKRVLLARLAPTSQLVEMNKSRQKVFTSIEMDPNFSDTGEAYLVGLAVTDTPASLGTEMLSFAVQNKDKFNQGTDLPDTVFTDAIENNAFEFEAPESNLLDKVKAMFSGLSKSQQDTNANQQESLNQMRESIELLAGEMVELKKQEPEKAFSVEDAEKLREQVKTLEASVTELNQKLQKSPGQNYTQRPASQGGETNHQTDC